MRVDDTRRGLIQRIKKNVVGEVGTKDHAILVCAIGEDMCNEVNGIRECLAWRLEPNVWDATTASSCV
jgi:hypothetical protein